MPTYEFRCPDGHVFDRFYRKISDAASEVPCPTCGKTATRQLSGGAGLVFKGSGFYLTDYGKNAHRGGESSKSSTSTSAESKSESKPTESKPAESKSSESKTSDSKPSSSSGSTTKSDK
jgi:putative FmdB family regulatory protein